MMTQLNYDSRSFQFDGQPYLLEYTDNELNQMEETKNDNDRDRQQNTVKY